MGENTFKCVKALLFDSGRVLNYSAAGNWFITPNFFNYVDKKLFDAIPRSKRDFAFKKAGEYISTQKLIKTEEEEFVHFLKYYRVLFESVGLQVGEDNIEAITKELVFNYDKYIFYQDAKEIVPALSTEYKLAIVSDAWPSLYNVYKKAGLRDYFDSFIISSVIGTRKPDKRMFTEALQELEVAPEDAIFIDDNIWNCDGAAKLGIRCFLLCRDSGMYWFFKLVCRKHKVIRNLQELNKYL